MSPQEVSDWRGADRIALKKRCRRSPILPFRLISAALFVLRDCRH